jgi:hypothetical protein
MSITLSVISSRTLTITAEQLQCADSLARSGFLFLRSNPVGSPTAVSFSGNEVPDHIVLVEGESVVRTWRRQSGVDYHLSDNGGGYVSGKRSTSHV